MTAREYLAGLKRLAADATLAECGFVVRRTVGPFEEYRRGEA